MFSSLSAGIAWYEKRAPPFSECVQIGLVHINVLWGSKTLRQPYQRSFIHLKRRMLLTHFSGETLRFWPMICKTGSLPMVYQPRFETEPWRLLSPHPLSTKGLPGLEVGNFLSTVRNQTVQPLQIPHGLPSLALHGRPRLVFL